MEGMVLMMLYIIIAVSFWYYPVCFDIPLLRFFCLAVLTGMCDMDNRDHLQPHY